MLFQRTVLLNAAALVVTLTVNYLSNALPINGKTPGQLSDQYPNLFVPAGLTFAIWGVIYLCLIAWVVAQVIGLWNDRIRAAVQPGVQRVGIWFALTCLLNVSWLFAWHYEYVFVSVVVMVALLGSLVQLNQVAGTGNAGASRIDKWLMFPGFGLYQGWITVALIANVTALLVSNGWDGGPLREQFWASFVIGVGVGIALWRVLGARHLFHGVAVIWALYGIYLKRQSIGDMASIVVGTAALMGIGVVLIAVVLLLVKNLRSA
jgi:hypothetical protein